MTQFKAVSLNIVIYLWFQIPGNSIGPTFLVFLISRIIARVLKWVSLFLNILRHYENFLNSTERRTTHVRNLPPWIYGASRVNKDVR